jgi:tetratricopeptide (TPR) repeat protein
MDGAKLVRLAAKRGALPEDQVAKWLGVLAPGASRPERALVDAGALTDLALRPLLREIRSGLPPGTPHALERVEDRLLAKIVEETKLAPRSSIEAVLASLEAGAASGRLLDGLAAASLIDEEAAEVALESFRASVLLCPECFARYDRARVEGPRVRCASCRNEFGLEPPAAAPPAPAKRPPSGEKPRPKRRSPGERKKLLAASRQAAALLGRQGSEPAVATARLPAASARTFGLVAGGFVLVSVLVGVALAVAFTGSPPSPAVEAPGPPTPALPPPGGGGQAPPTPALPPSGGGGQAPPTPALPPSGGGGQAPPTAVPASGGGGQAAFDAVRAHAKSLVAQGYYRDARQLFEGLLTSTDEDVPAAARAEIEAIAKLEALDAGAGKLTAAVDAAKDDRREDAVVALAAWWRAHLDDRGLAPVARVTERLAAERRKRFAREATAAAGRLEAAKAAIAARRASPAAAPDAWSERLALARAASAKKPFTVEVKDPKGKPATWKGLVVTRLDGRGFALASPARKLESTFAERPALALEILALARRPSGEERARDVLDDAKTALELDYQAVASALFEEHAVLVPGTGVPDLAAVRASRPFVAAIDPASPSESRGERLRFRLDHESGVRDFVSSRASDPARLSTGDGALVVEGGAGGGFAVLARRLEVEAGPIELEGELDPAETAPFLGFELEAEDRSHLVVDVSVEHGQTLHVATLSAAPPGGTPRADPDPWQDLARQDLAPRTSRMAIRLRASPGGSLEVFANGARVALTGAPSIPKTINATPRLGKLGGRTATLRKITLVASLRASWLARLQDEHERVLATELAKAEPPRASGSPLSCVRPSSEDPVELAGIPPGALAAYADARAALAKNDTKGARAALDVAVQVGAPFPAALILRARLDSRWNATRTLEDLDQTLAFMPGCPEALALRAEAWATLGYPEKASADLEAALAARSDLALAYRARGAIAFARRNPEIPGDARDAAADMELAAALSPDDASLAREARAASKLVLGPWAEGKEKRTITEHFVLRTDTEPKVAGTVAAALEEAWQVFARSFPPPATWRRAEVVVFSARPDYLDWARAFDFDMGATSAGFYDPEHDSLIFYEAAWDRTLDWARCVTVHEAFHQYARRSLPPLPNWLNEGLAESFGIEASGGKPREHGAYLAKFVAEPMGKPAREAWRAFLNGSYEAFHDKEHGEKARGENYARAWLLASILREKGGPFAAILPAILERARGGVITPSVIGEIFDRATVDALDKEFRVRARAALGG